MRDRTQLGADPGFLKTSHIWASFPCIEIKEIMAMGSWRHGSNLDAPLNNYRNKDNSAWEGTHKSQECDLR